MARGKRRLKIRKDKYDKYKPTCFGHFFGKNHREDDACIVYPKCKWRFQCALFQLRSFVTIERFIRLYPMIYIGNRN